MPIRITHEELAFLCRVMGHTALRGLPLRLAANQADEEQRLLAAAENSLRARNWLLVEHDQISLESTVMNALAFLMKAPIAVGVRRIEKGFPPDVRLLYASRDLQLQVSVDRGLYIIDAAPPEALDQLFRTLTGNKTAGHGARLPFLRIPAIGLIQVAAAAQISGATHQDLATELRSQGAYFAEIEPLFEFYRHEWLATVNLGVWLGTDVDDGAAHSSMTVLEAQNGYWRLEQHDADLISLVPLRPNQLQGLLINLEGSIRGALNS